MQCSWFTDGLIVGVYYSLGVYCSQHSSCTGHHVMSTNPHPNISKSRVCDATTWQSLLVHQFQVDCPIPNWSDGVRAEACCFIFFPGLCCMRLHQIVSWTMWSISSITCVNQFWFRSKRPGRDANFGFKVCGMRTHCNIALLVCVFFLQPSHAPKITAMRCRGPGQWREFRLGSQAWHGLVKSW